MPSRSSTSRADSVKKGANALPYGESIEEFDFIVNTAPARIIDEARLTKMKPDAEIVDIASPPYGVYPALPVKYRSESAGQIIAKIVTEGKL